MRTLDEKIKYNGSRNGAFSVGYVLGATFYRDYVKYDNKGKQAVDELIKSSNRMAKSGDEMSKGVMCGMRDAANERKAKKNR
ncbi:MAG: hypothetical protein NC131_00325 [Roseburia sp.]|nr:hypothetical protein [Roseburia sp.]